MASYPDLINLLKNSAEARQNFCAHPGMFLQNHGWIVPQGTQFPYTTPQEVYQRVTMQLPPVPGMGGLFGLVGPNGGPPPPIVDIEND